MNELRVTDLKLNDHALATLFQLGADTRRPSAAMLQGALEHLMSAPIERAVNQLPRAAANRLRREQTRLRPGSAARKLRLNTFGELLRHPAPPPELLELAKEFGKAIVHHQPAAWPKPVGEVLYYGAYAAAVVRGKPRPGSLNEQDLKAAFPKLRARQWIGSEQQGLFRAAEETLAHRQSPAP
jgi:hypothetical protein